MGGVGRDKKKFPESNLHVYGKNDTLIVVYNVKRWPSEGGWEKTPEKASSANYWTVITLLINKLLRWSYLDYAKDNLFILYPH